MEVNTQTQPAYGAITEIERKQPNRTKINWVIDLVVFLVFLVTTAPRFSGIAVHEWLSLALAAAIVAHLLLHWQWIVTTTRRLFSSAMKSQRLGYILNVLLFIDFTLITLSGILISRSALPALGISIANSGFVWRGLHSFASNAGLVLIALHIALHWQWVVSTFTRFIIKPFMRGNAVTQQTQKEG